MKVTAKLFAKLRDRAPEAAKGSAFDVELPGACTVGDLLRDWEIPEDIPLVIFVNSVHAEKDRVLQEGDVLAVFPPVGGG